jgi:hypothetical protein
MKWTKQVWLIAMAAFAGTFAAGASIENAESNDRSYGVIAERNPFNLRPAPQVAATTPTNLPAKTNLKLTGFTTLREKRAFFVVIDEKSKTNQPISLAIDQEVDGLKLLDVDPVFRKVRVLKDGIEKLMAFDTDGITNAVAVAAPAGTPGVPGIAAGLNRPGSPVPAPTVTPGTVRPGTTSPNTSRSGLRSIPSRNMRTSTDTGNSTIYAGAGSTTDQNTRFMPINNRGASQTLSPAPQPDRDAVEQIILMEAQRALNPNLPPTPGLPPPLPGTP